MLPARACVLIIGAGPSGSTLATLLKRARPETEVLVLEREQFPRHQIGESLLVDVNRILRDMGALADVEAAGFSRKYGATFVWGDGRDPFHFLWKEGAQIVNAPEGYQLEYTWHVDRAEYDQILMRCARRSGAVVLEGHTVTGFQEDKDGRVTGVSVTTDTGAHATVDARFVIDCGAAHGPIHRRLAGKQLDDELRNIAVHGYMKGVRTIPALGGEGDERRTVILTAKAGWVWLIPLRDGVTSVGFVTAVSNFRAAPETDARPFLEAALRSLREYDDLLAGAEFVDYRGDGRLVHAVQEYSYQCERVWGPGWATCGNAAGFVDAILSIGVYVAQTHAQVLACALRSVLDGDADEALALSCYAATVRENLSAFRAVAHMFYAFNDSMSEWWRECSTQLRQSTLVPRTGDKQAFLAFFTGFSARSAIYEEAVNAFGGSFLLDISHQLFGPDELFTGALAEETQNARQLIRRDPVLERTATIETRPFLLPEVGRGRVSPVTRMDISSPDDAPEGHELARRLYLPEALAAVPDLLDGRRRLRDVARALVQDGYPAPLRECLAEVMKLTYRLACMGAVREVRP